MALVSYKHNFVFIKTHKTASTSAEMFLEPFCARPGHMVTMTSPPRESEYGIIGCRNVPFDTPPYWEGHADMTLDQRFDANSAERVREVDRWIFDHCDYSSDVKEAVL